MPALGTIGASHSTWSDIAAQGRRRGTRRLGTRGRTMPRQDHGKSGRLRLAAR